MNVVKGIKTLKYVVWCGLYFFVAQAYLNAQSQFLTKEDSFNNEQTTLHSTTISGYGEVNFVRNNYYKNNVLNLRRAVLFIGHRFNKKISFFSEMEIENAFVVGNNPIGELSFEQLLLKFNLSKTSYLLAGVYLPRIGQLNEDHMPLNYFSVDRPELEALMLGTTWREIGVAYYLKVPNTPWYLSAGITNGLNSANFTKLGFGENKFNAQNASGNSMALNASIRYYKHNLRIQLAEYIGGTTGLTKRAADSLQLNSGLFANPLNIGVLDFLYQFKAWQFKGVAIYSYLPDAKQINTTYANIAPLLSLGAYVEIAYDLLHKNIQTTNQKQLWLFARYDRINFNASTYKVGHDIYEDKALNQHNVVCGLTFFPLPNVTIKTDIRFIHTGDINLLLNPTFDTQFNPNALPYSTRNAFIRVGIGYAF